MGEQLDIVTNEAVGFPANYPAIWHAVAMVEESFFGRCTSVIRRGRG